MNIYLDMDDVVADWLGFARVYLNEPNWVQGQMLPDHIWATLKQAPRMYRNLPKKAGADQLVNWVTNYADKRDCGLRFLSAIPHLNDTPWAIPDKHEWAREHYPHIPVFLGPYSHEKYMHCKSPEDILIDDRRSNCEEWIRAGGRAHIYTDWPRCKLWLEETLGPAPT